MCNNVKVQTVNSLWVRHLDNVEDTFIRLFWKVNNITYKRLYFYYTTINYMRPQNIPVLSENKVYLTKSLLPMGYKCDANHM